MTKSVDIRVWHLNESTCKKITTSPKWRKLSSKYPRKTSIEPRSGFFSSVLSFSHRRIDLPPFASATFRRNRLSSPNCCWRSTHAVRARTIRPPPRTATFGTHDVISYSRTPTDSPSERISEADRISRLGRGYRPTVAFENKDKIDFKRSVRDPIRLVSVSHLVRASRQTYHVIDNKRNKSFYHLRSKQVHVLKREARRNGRISFLFRQTHYTMGQH